MAVVIDSVAVDNAVSTFAECSLYCGSLAIKALCYKLVRDLMTSMIFINLPNPSGRTRPWDLLSP
jgi:hypothetical protein